MEWQVSNNYITATSVDTRVVLESRFYIRPIEEESFTLVYENSNVTTITRTPTGFCSEYILEIQGEENTLTECFYAKEITSAEIN